MVRQSSSPDWGFDDVGFRCVKNGSDIPADIEVPEEHHVPFTPPGGGEFYVPDGPGLLSMDGFGAGCELDRGFQAWFHLSFDAVTVTSAQLHIYDFVGGAYAIYPCTIRFFDADTYLILCDAKMPPSMLETDLPAIVDGLLEVTATEWDTPRGAMVGLLVSPCLEPSDWRYSMNASLSCPDAAGITTLSIHQEFTPAPEFINFHLIHGICPAVHLFMPMILPARVGWKIFPATHFLNG